MNAMRYLILPLLMLAACDANIRPSQQPDETAYINSIQLQSIYRCGYLPTFDMVSRNLPRFKAKYTEKRADSIASDICNAATARSGATPASLDDGSPLEGRFITVAPGTMTKRR